MRQSRKLHTLTGGPKSGVHCTQLKLESESAQVHLAAGTPSGPSPRPKRLARLLLLLANFGKDDEKPEPILAKISQETLADMIGTTRSRVSFFMNRFRKLGLIDYNGSIEVHSSLLNVVLHDEPHIEI
jgi:CRP-like cAMP-binding protein